MELLKKLSPAQAITFSIAAVVSLAILIFLSLKLTETPMAMLYTNLESDDSTLISSRLTGLGIEYRVSDNGKGIMVPVSKVTQLRMTFAEEGIPRSGSMTGYEIFDKNESLGTSQFVNNVNLIRALEGEIARTVGSLSHVESARVHIVLPKKELFSRSTAEPSASVVIRTRGGQELTKSEVSAITHLVSTAVPGLKVENITIVDHKGRPLKLRTSTESGMADLTEGISDYQRAVESKLRDTIEALLEKSVGANKVKASVSAEINFDREIINAEVYDPDGQVLRSRKVTEENEADKEMSGGGDGISVSENIPDAAGGTGGASGVGRNKMRTDELSNYEISKTVTNKISETGRIKKLSIAILVDGNYTQPKPDEKNPDGSSMRPQYSPRNADELEKLKLLAASAVGFDPRRGDKIEIVNMQFMDDVIDTEAEGGKFGGLIKNLENIIRTVVIGIVIILVIMLIVRPVIIKTLEARKAAQSSELEDAISNLQRDIEQQAEEEARAAQDSAPIEIIDLTAPEDKRKMNLIKQVNDIIDKHPEETVSIIRNWLYAGER